MTNPMMIVEPTEIALAQFPELKGKRGVVVGETRDGEWKVRLDGRKTAIDYSKEFWHIVGERQSDVPDQEVWGVLRADGSLYPHWGVTQNEAIAIHTSFLWDGMEFGTLISSAMNNELSRAQQQAWSKSISVGDRLTRISVRILP